MFAGRVNGGPPSVIRKSKPDGGKKSLLPKLARRPGSTDRSSSDARRPSSSYRSSSAEPARATLAVPGRPSREASASKLPINRRSRSQQGDRFGQTCMTPLRSSQHARSTTTPMRTPDDRNSRTWQTSLDRALAFVTIKDQRPITNIAWQRGELARVLEGLAAWGAAASGQAALTRPLTITRFVDVCNQLLSNIMGETKLNNDNYIIKLPNLAKRLLYPGPVSKSWLKTVNTLHAFPHALALIGYLLDLANHIDTPVSDEWLYAEKDELNCLRREFLHKSWIRFQEPEPSFEDIDAEYIESLKQVLGHDEDKLAQLKQTIQQSEAELEDEGEIMARAEEDRLRARRDALLHKRRVVRADRCIIRQEKERQLARRQEQIAALRTLNQDIATLTAENEQLHQELESQEMSVSERARLLEEVQYADKVIETKKTVVAQVSMTLASKEEELAELQQRSLAACVQYKQALIHLSARFPQLAALAVDEQQLMEPSCAEALSAAVDTLRAHAHMLAERRAALSRERAAHTRHKQQQLEETRARIAELKAYIAREQEALEAEVARENADAAAWAKEKEEIAAKVALLRASEDMYAHAQAELDFWEKQDAAWKSKLNEMRLVIAKFREQTARTFEEGKRRRMEAAVRVIRVWSQALDQLDIEEQQLVDDSRMQELNR